MKLELHKHPYRSQFKTSRLLLALLSSLLLFSAIMSFTSCAEMPVAVGVQGEHGSYSYSAERGLELKINATK